MRYPRYRGRMQGPYAGVSAGGGGLAAVGGASDPVGSSDTNTGFINSGDGPTGAPPSDSEQRNNTPDDDAMFVDIFASPHQSHEVRLQWAHIPPFGRA